MPPLTIAGRSFLVSADDFAFVVLPSAVLHLVWVAVDTSRMVQHRCQQLGVDPAFLILDACLCVALTVVDIVIAVLSAQGSVMAEPRHLRLFKCMLWPRLLLSLALFAIYMVIVVYGLLEALKEHGLDSWDPLGEVELQGWTWEPGWGDVVHGFWARVLAESLIFLRLVIMVPGAILLCAVMVPKHASAEIALSGVTKALQFAGVNDTMLQGIVKVLLDVMGQGTLDIATPTDLAFGLLLVAARQQQGPLGRRPCPEHGLPSSTLRASAITGVKSLPTPLDSTVREDKEALQMITHFVAYAVGIYGVGLDIFSKSVYHTSSLLSPFRLLRAVRRALFWRPPEPDEPAEVTGDLCCHLNERTLRRVLSTQARLAHTAEPELLWATWKKRGQGTSPPMAVAFDPEYKKLVIVIRGTMDMKDCISDLGADPAFFDPLGLAEPEVRKEPPFDDTTGLYAHSTMVSCARDALACLKEARILEKAFAPDGIARGCKILCTGHSLGSGVACLLALLLRAEPGLQSAEATYIGFEPPGGMLSRRLVELTGQLGFLSAVCANDWISRLSIRGVQEVRERVLDELEQCNRSKVQLTCLVLGRSLWLNFRRISCITRPLLRLSEWLGGGELRFEEPAANAAPLGSVRRGFSPLRSKLQRCQPEGHSLFSELWPPSRIVYFRPVAVKMWLCGMYEVATSWTAEWVQPEDLHELIISARSVELHFPNIIKAAYRSAAVNLQAVDYSDRGSSVVSDESDTSSLRSGDSM